MTAVSAVTHGLLGLSCIREWATTCEESKAGSSGPPWLPLQFLPPDPCFKFLPRLLPRWTVMQECKTSHCLHKLLLVLAFYHNDRNLSKTPQLGTPETGALLPLMGSAWGLVSLEIPYLPLLLQENLCLFLHCSLISLLS